MKKALAAATIILLIFSSCSKKEPLKLETFSSEAFAYQMGDSSEVDATTRVKGFQLNEENGMYTATLGYDIDLVTPKGDTVKSLISKVTDKSQKDKISEIPLEIQFDLDSTYAKGNYKLIFRVKDELSGQTSVSSAGFSIDE